MTTLPTLLVEGAVDFTVSKVATQALATPKVRHRVGGDVHLAEETLASPVLRTVTVGAVTLSLLQAAEAEMH